MKKFLLTTATIFGLGAGVLGQQAHKPKKVKTGFDCDKKMIFVQPDKLVIIDPCNGNLAVGEFKPSKNPVCADSETAAYLNLDIYIDPKTNKPALDQKGRITNTYTITEQSTGKALVADGRGYPSNLHRFLQNRPATLYEEINNFYYTPSADGQIAPPNSMPSDTSTINNAYYITSPLIPGCHKKNLTNTPR